MAFLTIKNLNEIGFKSIGRNVLISDKASIYNPGAISLGDNVRIDDFCILSAGDGGIDIGCYVHIAAYSSLIGAGRIVMEDFSGLSSKVAIYSSNDDYSGDHMTNPTVPSKFTCVTHADVVIKKHAIVGAGSVILPGVILEEGVAIAALSFVTKSCATFGIYSGNRRIAERSRKLLELEEQMQQVNIES